MGGSALAHEVFSAVLVSWLALKLASPIFDLYEKAADFRPRVGHAVPEGAARNAIPGAPRVGLTWGDACSTD